MRSFFEDLPVELEEAALYGQAAVVSILIMIPAVLLYILLQKHFIRGMTFGAVKG